MSDSEAPHSLDAVKTMVTSNAAAAKDATVARGTAELAVKHATVLGERTAVLEHRASTTDEKLDRIGDKVDAVHVQLGRLVERSPWERGVFLALALAALAYFALAIGDRLSGAL